MVDQCFRRFAAVARTSDQTAWGLPSVATFCITRPLMLSQRTDAALSMMRYTVETHLASHSRSAWEDVFSTWSNGPGSTEQTKMENAERAVRKAISASASLSRLAIQIFPQGSYRNRTNVRQESDVDICVCLMSTFHYELPPGGTMQEAGVVPSDYTYPQYKSEIHAALLSHFGHVDITPGKKAFDVHSNTYRVDADVVPTFEYRWYRRDSNGRLFYVSGTQLIPDGGTRIENYPNQHYARGVEKNDRTNKAFKRVVRILKRLRNEMAANGNEAAEAAPSYFIECLVGSVSEDAFMQDSWFNIVRWVFAEICNATRDSDETAKDWLEVNRIKLLFHANQPWTKATANAFGNAAWKYIAFED